MHDEFGLNICFPMKKWRLIDSHCHFDFMPFAHDPARSLQQAHQNGVERLIVPGVTSNQWPALLDLATRFTAVSVALGLHPRYLHSHHPDHVLHLEHLLQQKQHHIVALGEMGLDGLLDPLHFEQQIELLELQLNLAQRYDLPVILHSVRTHDRLAALLRRYALTRTGVIHGFSGSLEQVQNFVRLGYKIGVGGSITYARAQKTRRAVAALPLTSLVLETDAPDMPISGYQGEANRPERLPLIFQALCELRSESPDEIAHQIYDNTCQLFDLVPL